MNSKYNYFLIEIAKFILLIIIIYGYMIYNIVIWLGRPIGFCKVHM